MENKINKPENPYYSNTDTTKLHLTDADWKKVLPEDVSAVTNYFVPAPSFPVAAAGRVFSNKTIKTVLFIKKTIRWAWNELKLFVEDAPAI